ncbi:multiple sugar transport system ATP-binding protein [Devosia sp. UYZn731]|uniref:ABC transporter ATP-binding protein n=1 Tax=Devosia sp. UYZn731 TaxID=3156345 RepID=UPI0033915AE9
MAGIICQNLNKKYGVTEVVPDFNLEVSDHEFVVFLGPSGCGKSTILRMIAGLEDISGGSLSIDSKVVTDLEPRDRGVAMVFQNYALYPHMTIRDNIAFGLRRLKVPEPEIDKRIDGVVAMLGLGPVINRKPTELSGGQQQRVAIARAMIKTPKVFLFDEPLSNLDAKLRAQMRFEIARLHKQLRTTTIYVTHDQMEAMTLADRIVLLNAGRIEQVGAPQQIYERPATLFVAGFIGTPAMNLLPMTVERSASGWKLEGAGAQIGISGNVFDLKQDQQVVLGVRPADLLATKPNADGNLLAGTTDMVEFHGDHTLVGFAAGNVRVNAFVPSRDRPAEGDEVAFTVMEAAIHLFDAAGGHSLFKEPGAGH